jgi:hypothetical protein
MIKLNKIMMINNLYHIILTYVIYNLYKLNHFYNIKQQFIVYLMLFITII